jgi:hypothetical protein
MPPGARRSRATSAGGSSRSSRNENVRSSSSRTPSARNGPRGSATRTEHRTAAAHAVDSIRTPPSSGRQRGRPTDMTPLPIAQMHEDREQFARDAAQAAAAARLIQAVLNAAAERDASAPQDPELLPRLLLCHADAPALLGSRQRALCCRPPSERLAGPLTFVTAFGLRRVPYARPGLCVSRAPPTHPRLSRGRACASRIARTCIARLPPSAVRPSAAQLL